MKCTNTKVIGYVWETTCGDKYTGYLCEDCLKKQNDELKSYLQELTDHFEINEIDGDVIYFGEVDVIKQASLYLNNLDTDNE